MWILFWVLFALAIAGTRLARMILFLGSIVLKTVLLASLWLLWYMSGNYWFLVGLIAVALWILADFCLNIRDLIRRFST